MKQRFLSFAMAALFLAMWPAFGAAQETVRHIVVTGEGRALAVPDMAEVQFGVTHQAPRAQAAMDAVSRDVRALFEAMVDEGIAARDIQTTSLRLDPRWEQRLRDQQGPPEIRGFVATNQVTVRLRDMSALGRTLQTLLDKGANRFSAIRFTLADPGPAQAEARREAVRDARAKAELYAEAAGVSLGEVLRIVETGAAAPRPAMMAEARMAMDSAMPVAGGELNLRAQVTITYALGN
ncbi:SIMPL domain-containing protein [Primorskyibacter sp. S187A]|uniref:SIMPL domain-containing protein n=1 Tax=Primorskyibacter sp. S187A TaxID=3415130 RepID=UPI003C7E28D4